MTSPDCRPVFQRAAQPHRRHWRDRAAARRCRSRHRAPAPGGGSRRPTAQARAASSSSRRTSPWSALAHRHEGGEPRQMVGAPGSPQPSRARAGARRPAAVVTTPGPVSGVRISCQVRERDLDRAPGVTCGRAFLRPALGLHESPPRADEMARPRPHYTAMFTVCEYRPASGLRADSRDRFCRLGQLFAVGVEDQPVMVIAGAGRSSSA